MPGFRHGALASSPAQSKRDLWRKEWHWDIFKLQNPGCSPSDYSTNTTLNIILKATQLEVTVLFETRKIIKKITLIFFRLESTKYLCTEGSFLLQVYME
jgi:hypothetical protein